MISNDGELREGLRALAASTLQQAPVTVEHRLIEQFRRRRQLRRWTVWSSAIAAGAAAAGIAVFFAMPPMPQQPEAIVVHIAPPAIAQPNISVVAQHPIRKRRVPIQAADANEVATRFYSLPDADGLPPVDDATVVRVQLPRSAMRLVGLPVNEERVGERIQADIVLGQDGLMRAVRFLQ